MSMKILITGLLAAVGMGGGVCHAETLTQAIEVLLAEHPNIRAQAYNRLARDEEVRQARAPNYPRFDFQAGVGIENISEPADSELTRREFALSLRQNLFTGFATKNEVARQKARVESAIYRLQADSENLSLIGISAYLGVLRRKDLVRLAVDNIEIHERLIDQIKLRSESGVASGVDLDQALGRLALAQSNLVIAQTNLRDAETTYRAVIGHPPQDLVRPRQPREAIPGSLEEVIDIALQNHPQLKSAEADLEARREQHEVAKAPYYPIIDLELDKYWYDNVDGFEGEEEEWLAMLRLRYNFFNGFATSARRGETAMLINEAEAIMNNTHRQVIESVELSWMALESANQRLPYLIDRVESATRTADSYVKQWNIGRRTLLDVLDSKSEVLDARRDLINSTFNGQRAEFRLLNGMGRLVHTLGLEWPEEGRINENNNNS